jgi:hypothetical protein
MADFEVTADSERITIDGFLFVPGEAEVLKNSISFAGSMRKVSPLPPQISFPPFVVQFFEDGTLVVGRDTLQGGQIKFSFNTVDVLVSVITDALGVSIDRKRLRPSPRSVGDPGFMADGDIIEG